MGGIAPSGLSASVSLGKMQSNSTLKNNKSWIFREKPPILALIKHNKATEEHQADYAVLRFPWTYSKQDVTPQNQQWKREWSLEEQPKQKILERIM